MTEHVGKCESTLSMNQTGVILIFYESTNIFLTIITNIGKVLIYFNSNDITNWNKAFKKQYGSVKCEPQNTHILWLTARYSLKKIV